MIPYRFGWSGTGTIWIVALVCALAWSKAAARHVTDQMIDASGASLESVPCWFDADIERQTDCFQLVVPFDWTDPNSAMQHLPVVIFRGAGHNPPGGPIIYLTGGPGLRAYIEHSENIIGWSQWLEYFAWTHGRDFIVPTQRGTNWTDSDLHCAPLGDPRVYTGASDEPGNMTEWHGNVRRAARDCRDQLVNAGVPIAAFNTKQNATDMAALRHLLDLVQWSVYGVSYGTRLGLTLMRHDPDGVSRAILDSLWPPAKIDHDGGVGGLDRAIRRLFGSCRALPRCNDNYPRLEWRILEIVEQLRRQPLEYAAKSEDGTQTLYVMIDARLFIDIVFYGLYRWEYIELMPRMIHQFAMGDLTTFHGMATYYMFDEPYELMAHGMTTAVNCNDNSAFVDRDFLARQKVAHPLFSEWIAGAETYLDSCDGWPLGEPDPQEKTPVVSDIPTLLLAGAFDPITPPENASFAAETLSNSYLFVMPSSGHSAIDSHYCASDLVAAFMADPLTRPNVGCPDPDETPNFQ